MSLELQNGFGIKLDTERARRALKLLEQHVQSSSDAANSGYVPKLREVIEEFFNTLGRPITEDRSIDERSRPTAESMNKLWRDLGDDVHYLYDIYRQLTETAHAGFNHVMGVHTSVEGNIKDTAIKAVDTSLAFGISQTSVFTAGDNFENSDLIAGGTIDRPYASNAVTLRRVNTNRLGPNDFTLEVNYDESQYGGDKFYASKPYEGYVIAPSGEARPTYGKFKFKKILPDRYYEDADGNPATTPQVKEGTVLKRENFYTVLVDTTDAEKELARSRMFDDDPSTFWELERNIRLLRDPESPDDINDYESNPDIKDKLDEKAGVNGVLNFTFNNKQTVNWISLNPVHYSPRSSMLVERIEYSLDGNNWFVLPGFNSNRSANVLTQQANNTVDDDTLQVTMEKSKYSFTGKGLWIFPPTTMRFLRIFIRNDTSYLNTYETISFQRKRTVRVQKSGSKFLGVKLSKDKDKTKTYTQEGELPYMHALAVFEGEGTIEEFVNEAVAQAQSKDTLSSLTRLVLFGPLDFITDKLFGFRLVEGIFRGIGLFSGGKTKVTDSGWELGQTWIEEKHDVERYAFGIRELSLNRNEYDESSEFVSVPFTIPSPIQTIKLYTDETIPETFSNQERWIEYYVSIDDGNTWTEIAPTGANASTFLEGGRVNQVISITTQNDTSDRDKRVTYLKSTSPVTSVRFKAILRRPSGEVYASPAIKWYKLVITTDNTFAGFKG